MPDPSVAVVDDHELLVHTLTLALSGSGVRCVGVTPAPSSELLSTLADVGPSLVLLDLDLGEFGDSTSLIAPLTAAGIPVLVLTAQTDRIRQALAIEQGAIGIQPKAAGFAETVEAVRRASTGASPDPAGSAGLLDELASYRERLAASRRPFDGLTERERQTLAELAAGRTVQQIASRWVVSQATVRTHVQGVLTKLGATSQLQAVVMAVRAGWLTPERDERAS
jgi:DNA-binding NarL/FixJ family response regulator